MVIVLEWSVIGTVVSIIMSVGVVLVTYGKQWSRFELSIQNLSNVVDRLNSVVDNMAKEQLQMVREVTALKTELADINRRLEKLESKIDRRNV